MPLRDHFCSPIKDRHAWSELHSMWPAMIVRHLFDILPAGYVCAPSVHFGKLFEIDVSTFELDERAGIGPVTGAGDGGVATVAPPEPTLTLETDLSEQDEFEVRVYDAERGRTLVAAIEIVSPANKDRPENRRAFVAKVAALLQKDVCVSVVDLVTIRQFNLYADLLELIGGTDPQLGPDPPHLYSVTIRSRKRTEQRSLLDLWYYPMALGQILPTLPIWLDADRRVMLPLEPSYEETCRLLHMA
ncbi:DUF4058 family protein [Frigoriglobus tundricola]|uniref:DUF4058 family protein n=1 Tax=Frigoriglobus tundricola TaxID=2774151 RepID=A0A6M5YWQ4_9BACT|nr:DUF4058 family protein [Frigoriglobus tundricola]QJW97643.1 hypothetical protein FTUN_5220 [Frigoriglobus tundricola]